MDVDIRQIVFEVSMLLMIVTERTSAARSSLHERFMMNHISLSFANGSNLLRL